MFFRKPREKKLGRTGSLAFYLSIPASFVIAGFGGMQLASFVGSAKVDFNSWALFIMGFVAAAALVFGGQLPRIRTLIHELKHAIVVVLTGGELRGMKVGRGTGHVEFAMYKESVHMAPFVALAPYFVPLLSLPALIVSVFLESSLRYQALLGLGFALGADLSMNFRELHPHQSDLRAVYGGIFISRLFIFGLNAAWAVIALFMVAGGSEGYRFLFQQTIKRIFGALNG